MEHCASGMDSENRIVVGKPDVSQGRKARSFLLYFLQAEGSSAAIAFPARGWLLQSFFCVYGFFGRSKERKIMTVKECYSQMNGDYNNVQSRFYDEAMIKRLLGGLSTTPAFVRWNRRWPRATCRRPSMRRIPSGASVRACRLPNCAARWTPSPRRCGAAISLRPQPTWTRQSGSMT